MLRRLNKLRNSIEHDGAQPPSIEQCRDYEEVVWYFLKVTTPYLRPPRDADLAPDDAESSDDDHIHLNYEVRYKPLKISISGILYAETTSASAIEGWLKVKCLPIPRHHKSLNDLAAQRDLRRVPLYAEIIDPTAQSMYLRDVYSQFF
jgi:hypothetical protein